MTISLPIPDRAKILVKVGQNIDFDTKLFELSKPTIVKINLAQQLRVPPEKIFQYLKKFVDENVKKGEIIATKKGFFTTKKIESNYDGLLKEINHQSGEVIIETTIDEQDCNQSINFYSPIVGEIEKIKKENLTIKIKKKEIVEIKEKTNENFGAPIFLLEKDSDLIRDNIENRLIIGEAINDLCQIKAEALGAKGFLTIKKMEEESLLPAFQFKDLTAIKKIFSFTHIDKHITADINKTNELTMRELKKKYYCFIEKNSSKMIFYE